MGPTTSVGGPILLLLVVFFGIGLLLIIRGWRGRPRLSQPTCARCGYDLRIYRFDDGQQKRCPECGSDLSPVDAVKFGRFAKRKGMLITGAAMIVLPVLLVVPSFFLVRGGPIGYTGPGGVGAKSNPQLIASLPTTADEPWTWSELESRLNAGKLSNAEAAAAVDELIKHLNAQRAAGEQIGHLPWCGGFLKTVDGAGIIPTEQRLRLAKAVHGATAEIRTTSRVRENKPLVFAINYGNSFELPGTKFVKALREVRLADGTKLPLAERFGQTINADGLSGDCHWSIDGSIPLKLPPGEHELTFTIDAGLLPEGTEFIGMNNKPGQKNRWMKPLATWTLDVPVKVTVVPADQCPIATIEDPLRDPSARLKQPKIIVKPHPVGVSVEVRIERAGDNTCPVSSDVQLRMGGKTHPAGEWTWGPQGSGYSGVQLTLKSLPADVTAADLILHPNPSHAEKSPGITQIWGRDIVFYEVPLQRLDLTPEAQSAEVK